jgi:hypothetical protein
MANLECRMDIKPIRVVFKLTFLKREHSVEEGAICEAHLLKAQETCMRLLIHLVLALLVFCLKNKNKNV